MNGIFLTMKSKRSILTMVCLFLLFGPVVAPVRGEIYQFVSPDGVIHFTNVPTDPRYRRMTEESPSARRQVRSEVQATILSEARQHQIDPALIKAVIKVESDFDPYAISPAGAIGLMQLMPATLVTLDVRNPFSVRENIAGGVRHLRDLLDRFGGSLTLALAAYHAGAERVEQYGHVPPIEQTHRYIRKVMAAYQTYLKKDGDIAAAFQATDLK
jgi:soluble lytic murein transglycosylase